VCLTRASQRHVRRTAALTGAAVLMSVALAACSSGSSGGGGSQGYVDSKQKSALDHYPVGRRQAAPALSGETLDKKRLNVADYRGKVVVLNVWGSWCPPCRAEEKNLVKVAGETKGKGVVFVGINTRDTDPANAVAFERSHHVPYPSLYDPAGKLLAGFRGTVPPQTIPTTLVLDRKGRIAARALQPLSEDDVHALLDPVLAEKG
jgi:thiol-disulfide isomerase/thioredoxin